MDATPGVLAEVASRPGPGEEPVIAIRICEPGLARFLHRARARRMVVGCRVERRNPSEALGVGLEDATLSEAFTVDDAVRRHIPR